MYSLLHLQTRKLRFCKVRAPVPITQLIRDRVGLISDDPFRGTGLSTAMVVFLGGKYSSKGNYHFTFDIDHF